MQTFPYILGNILIVEDNEWDRLVAETLLKKEFNVSCASNPTDAIKAVEENPYDIILMDLNLGIHVMDGVELMQKIKSDPRFHHIKIFAVTAYSENKEDLIKLGFDELYIKPVIKEEMKEAILKALNRSQPQINITGSHRNRGSAWQSKKSYICSQI